MKVKLLKKFRKLIAYEKNAFYGIYDYNGKPTFKPSYVGDLKFARCKELHEKLGIKPTMIFMTCPISVDEINAFFERYKKYSRRWHSSSARLRRVIEGDFSR